MRITIINLRPRPISALSLVLPRDSRYAMNLFRAKMYILFPNAWLTMVCSQMKDSKRERRSWTKTKILKSVGISKSGISFTILTPSEIRRKRSCLGWHNEKLTNLHLSSNLFLGYSHKATIKAMVRKNDKGTKKSKRCLSSMSLDDAFIIILSSVSCDESRCVL